MPSETSSTASQPSAATDADSTTELSYDPLAASFFQMRTRITRFKPRETEAATLDYSYKGSESSTSQLLDPGELEKKASALFISAREQIFEDGMESGFSREIAALISSHGRAAMEVIIPLLLSDWLNPEVTSEALRVVGRIHHPPTYRDRLWLLERGLYSPSARVRDGATLGLAYLDDPIAITPLKYAIERESVPELRQDMEQVLAQLEDTQKWPTS